MRMQDPHMDETSGREWWNKIIGDNCKISFQGSVNILSTTVEGTT